MTVKTSVKTDQYQGHDYYLLDELLSEDHLPVSYTHLTLPTSDLV